MNRLFFVVNDLSEFDFQDLLMKHLPGVPVDVGTQLPEQPFGYRLIILWNYRRILRKLPSSNIIIFHSSDLPDGRGWAPIYYAVAEQKQDFVISGILAAPDVDAGDIIVKAKFKILANYTASHLRSFDRELSIILVSKILSRFEGREIVGIRQSGAPTFRYRRTQEDSQIDVNQPFADLIPHLRACEPQFPAYFDYRGHRYLVSIAPVVPPEFPQDISISFGEDHPLSI
jgi:methionyl-tRNA formyltransferase